MARVQTRQTRQASETSLAAGFPIKKWSAAAAPAASLFYLLLSGAEVATLRSFFMTAVVLIAVMIDRAPSPSVRLRSRP